MLVYQLLLVLLASVAMATFVPKPWFPDIAFCSERYLVLGAKEPRNYRMILTILVNGVRPQVIGRPAWAAAPKHGDWNRLEVYSSTDNHEIVRESVQFSDDGKTLHIGSVSLRDCKADLKLVRKEYWKWKAKCVEGEFGTRYFQGFHNKIIPHRTDRPNPYAQFC